MKKFTLYKKLCKGIFSLIRENAKNQFNNTMRYVLIGEARFKNNEGSKPMSIKLEFHEPAPNYLWKKSANIFMGLNRK